MSNMCFVYTDSRGVTTRRILNDYTEDEIYLRGYCLYSKGIRLFRRDRIDKKFTEETPEFLTHPLPTDPSLRPSKKKEGLDICFTGFAKADRERLEKASNDNNLEVRKSVTKNLQFLCTGYNAGAKKLQKAESQGVVLITEDQFIELIKDGVMPEGWTPK